MTRTLQILKAITLVCASIALISVAAAAGALERSVNEASASLQQLTTDAQKRMDGTFQNLNAVLIQSGLTADEVRRTSLEERAKIAAFSDASIQAVQDLDAVARNGATAVEGLGQAVAALGGTASALRHDAEQASSTITGATQLISTLNDGAKPVLDHLGSATGHADELIASLSPIRDQALETAKHFNGTSAEMEQSVGFIRDRLRPTKPGFWHGMFYNLLPAELQVILHFLPQRTSISGPVQVINSSSR